MQESAMGDAEKRASDLMSRLQREQCYLADGILEIDNRRWRIGPAED
jgi:hypothetical protein